MNIALVAKKRLGDILVESGLLTPEDILKTLETKQADQKLGDALIQNGLITETQLIEALEAQLGVPHVNLYKFPIDRSLVSVLSEEEAKQKEIIPIKKESNRLTVAMADPLDLFTIEELRMMTGFEIEPVIATKEEIRRTISKVYESDSTLNELMSQVAKDNKDTGETVDNDSPIAKLANRILFNAIDQRASDIHIDPHENRVTVRYRIDGNLKTDRELPKDMQNMLTARIKIMSNLNITENRLPQDGRVKLTVEGHPIDLRVSTIPTVHGEKIVLRVLDLQNTVHDPQKIGLTPENLKTFIRFIEKPNGIVLITGPTGSGKTSTLYSALNHLNKEEVNIITIEDPVEIHLDGINQIQVNPKIGLTFASGLRSILRQDPNIIMIGEIRDTETADIAIRASLTGHLVLSTIHTNDSVSTITRLLDMKVEPFLIATSLTGVIAQRLIRTVCRDCSEYEAATDREKEIFAARGLTLDKVKRGKGCRSCNMTGYRGRIAIHEMLSVDSEIRRLIMDHEHANRIRDYLTQKKMKYLIDDGFLKVLNGMTTTEEVIRVVTGAETL